MSGVLPLDLVPTSGAAAAKEVLAAVTTLRSVGAGGGWGGGGGCPAYRSLTPDKLSALRSGTSLLIRSVCVPLYSIAFFIFQNVHDFAYKILIVRCRVLMELFV
jgi:hypothetical protein